MNTAGKRLLIMAAGTGGHIFPGLAIADTMRERGWQVSWLGTTHGMEKDLVPRHGLEMDSIVFAGLRGKGLMHTVKGVWRMVASFGVCFGILGKRQPDVVLGMGGYVTVPGGAMARLRGVPLALVNADAALLLSNKTLTPLADKVLFGFPADFGKAAGKAEVTGNPVRKEIIALPLPATRYANHDGPLRILVVGGSLGAKVLNETVPAALAKLPADQRPLVTHQSGKQHIDALRAAYAQAGMADVALAYEPLGAAYWYARALERDETVLVADFGGGTSDFSVLRFTRAGRKLEAEPLAHSGVGVAGDTFDYRIIDHVVAPRLGKGATYRSFEKALPIPAYIHASFAQWHQLSWLKSGNTLVELRKLAEASARGDELEALITIVEMDMGFALYQAIGGLKAALSRDERAQLRFAGWGVDIAAEVTRAEFEGWISADLARIDGAIDAALAEAGLAEPAIDAVFVTGGTSYVPAVRRLFDRRFPAGRIHQGDAFQSVASGLALMAADRAASSRR